METGNITAGIIGLRRLLEMGGPPSERARTLLALGEAHLRQGDQSTASQVLREAEDLYRNLDAQYWRAKVLLLLAQTDPVRATRWYQQAGNFSDGDPAYDHLLVGRSRLSITRFGRSAITVDGHPCRFATHNAELAVYLLALAPGATLHAEVLADHLWSDLPADKQAGRVRTLLWHVRRGLGLQHAWRVNYEHKVVKLNLAGVSVDALAWRAAAHALLRGDQAEHPSGEQPPSAIEVVEALRQPLLIAWRYEEWVSEYEGQLHQLSMRLGVSRS